MAAKAPTGYLVHMDELHIEQLGSRAFLRGISIADGFAAITPSPRLHGVLADVLAEGGVITAALRGSMLVGYVADLPFVPIPLWRGELRRRWQDVPSAREVGGIEVARPFRRGRIAQRLLGAIVGDGRLDASILIAEGFHSHWDVDHRSVSVWDARAQLIRLFQTAGFARHDTDEPEVSESPANFLAARIGPRVPELHRAAFLHARFAGTRRDVFDLPASLCA